LKTLSEGEGVSQWDTWFCSLCFIGHAARLHRELSPEQLGLLKVIGKQAAGLMPPDLVELIAVGFYRRITGKKDEPPEDQLALFVGEIQRLAALSMFSREMNLLETWKGMFVTFTEERMEEIRVSIRRMTEGE
jgi:hypothetical protein